MSEFDDMTAKLKLQMDILRDVDTDGLRCEAAEQYGFKLSPYKVKQEDTYTCTESQLIAFAMACERAGTYRALEMLTERVTLYDAHLDLMRGNIHADKAPE